MKVDKKYIKNLQGKDFVLYAGLLDVAHNLGLTGIKTEIWSHDDNQTIVKATATMKDGKSFDGIGDADKSNVNSMIAKHRIRMAETRAKARALRDACNIDMCTVEELGGEDNTSTPADKADFYTTHRFKSGKMAGKSFPEISDKGWLQWIAENSKHDETKKSAVRRISELGNVKSGLSKWADENDAPTTVPH